jgi:hypothetical protein
MAMEKSHRISISSPPDREKLLDEISFGNVQWADFSNYRRSQSRVAGVTITFAVEFVKKNGVWKILEF